MKFTKVYDYYLKYWYRFDGANFETKHRENVLWSKNGMEKIAFFNGAEIQLTDNFDQ
jgi:hypothetical protein